MMPTYLEAKKEALAELVVQHKHRYLSVPGLFGGTGIGKTEMAADLSVEIGEVIGDALLFEPIATGEASDPTDTAGIPWVISVEDPENKVTAKEYKTLWVLNRAAYQACRLPTLLLFDDIDKATPIVVNSLLNLFVHRRFKDFELHPNSLMMCAGNRGKDDVNANELSESMKTRVTVIEVEAKFEDFAEYSKKTDPPRIHPMLIGYLSYRPEHLFMHQEGVYRFPTPRGYRETSLHMFEYDSPDLWKRTIERKLGTPVANDFWSWYTILSKIDVDYILEHGTLKESPEVREGMTAEVAQKMAEFAAVFAITDRLNKKIRDDHTGLEKFTTNLSPELRVAFLLQLHDSVKTKFRKYYKTAAGKIMATVIKDSDEDKDE